MANVIYPKWKEALMNGEASAALDSSDVKLVLIDTADYTYAGTHEFLDDVAAAARVATTAALSSKVVSSENFDAADVSFSSVTGDECEAIIVFNDTGTATTSRLVAYYDTGITNFPITPNGGDIDITINASGLFDL